jgi:hypothetical protein
MNLWEVVIPQLGIIFAATIAVWGYSKQKKVELEKSLVETRRTLYRNFLTSLTLSTRDQTPEAHAKYLAASAELNVVATDDVLFAVGEFQKYANVTPQEKRDNDTMKVLIAKVALQMRKDCFEKSKLDINIAKELLPFR